MISLSFRILLALNALLLPLTLQAAGSKGLAFLKIGVGARAGAMGEAYTAHVGDATAPYWNPAGAASIQHRLLVVSTQRLFMDISHSYFALVLPGQNSSWALHGTLLNVDGIEQRTRPSEEPLGTVAAHDVAVGLTYARTWREDWRFGATLNFVYEKIYVETASGFSMNLGAQWQIAGVMVGGSLSNLGRTNNLKRDSIPLPLTARLGLAAPFSLGEKTDILAAADFVQVFDEDLRFHFGTEVTLWKHLSARAGYMAGYDLRSFTAGGGVHQGRMDFDYGFSPFESDFGGTHRFSVGLRL